MTTLSLKTPEGLLKEAEAVARRRGISRSALVREALAAYIEDAGRIRGRPGSCLEAAGDLIGSVEGPEDLSIDRRHIDGFGQ